jgi:hypothetical protein
MRRKDRLISLHKKTIKPLGLFADWKNQDHQSPLLREVFDSGIAGVVVSYLAHHGQGFYLLIVKITFREGRFNQFWLINIRYV